MSSQYFGDVKVKEVDVENGLHASGNNGDIVVESFVVESPDPVDEVQGSVGSEEE